MPEESKTNLRFAVPATAHETFFSSSSLEKFDDFKVYDTLTRFCALNEITVVFNDKLLAKEGFAGRCSPSKNLIRLAPDARLDSLNWTLSHEICHWLIQNATHHVRYQVTGFFHWCEEATCDSFSRYFVDGLVADLTRKSVSGSLANARRTTIGQMFMNHKIDLRSMVKHEAASLFEEYFLKGLESKHGWENAA